MKTIKKLVSYSLFLKTLYYLARLFVQTNKELSKEKQELLKKLNDKDGQLKQLQQREEELNKRITQFEADNNAKSKQIESLIDQIKELNVKFSSVSTELE